MVGVEWNYEVKRRREDEDDDGKPEVDEEIPTLFHYERKSKSITGVNVVLMSFLFVCSL